MVDNISKKNSIEALNGSLTKIEYNIRSSKIKNRKPLGNSRR